MWLLLPWGTWGQGVDTLRMELGGWGVDTDTFWIERGWGGAFGWSWGGGYGYIEDRMRLGVGVLFRWN